MPICRDGGDDVRIWSYSKNGECTVKSGYRKLKEGRTISDDRPSSSHRLSGEMWSIIWKLKVPSKIYNFLWKLFNNVVHVRLLLWKRIVMETPICLLCNEGEESIEHMLLECDWTRGYGMNVVLG